jgi:DNA-directed RNA polymerase specialized sigma24 family protein
MRVSTQGPNVLASGDADLVENIRNGRAESEAALYEKYSARVYYVALRGSRSPHGAEDVRAETLLAIGQLFPPSQRHVYLGADARERR